MNETQSSSNLLNTKPHFAILDGLRGVAAVSVVIFHFMEIAIPDYKDNFIAHAYLAVDFFFCLSGFVIAYAYDSKLKEIGLRTFFKLRLIRLHPLVVIGSVIGLLFFVFDPFSDLYKVYADRLLQMFIASLLMIPYPIVHERYLNLFHLNAPAWSLFWEYAANILYAFVLVKVKNKLLWILTIIGAVALCYEGIRSGYLAVGFGGDNIRAGGIRMFYSFLAGMLVYRSNRIIRTRLGFTALSILLVIVFLIPFYSKGNWITDTLVIIFYLPLLVALGAGAAVRPAVSRICKFSGEISYPLYMVHYPFIWIFYSYVEAKKPGIGEMTVIMIIGVALLMVFAYLVMKYLDIPIRNYLKRKLKGADKLAGAV